MTPAELRALGLAIYGPEWQAPLARALGVNPRTVRKLAAGELAISAGMEADIRRVLGVNDPDALDKMWPRDEWIIGDSPERPDGTRAEYIVHTRRPRFIARVAADDDDADRAAGVVYQGDGYVLCEIAWIDPPPGPVALTRLLDRACDAIDGEA